MDRVFLSNWTTLLHTAFKGDSHEQNAPDSTVIQVAHRQAMTELAEEHTLVTLALVDNDTVAEVQPLIGSVGH